MASLGPKEIYLVLYNSLCCVGWATVLAGAIKVLIGGDGSILDSLANVYGPVATLLTITQSAALLEIMHSAVGLVRSPVLVTAMQVSSRIFALVAVVYSPEAQAQWGAGLMIISWSMVEVPRYAFYVSALITGDATKKSPYPLFWLRYSLFGVLYPTGITGELTCFFAAASDAAFGDIFGAGISKFVFAYFLPFIYFFGSPFMIMNMVGNRKKAFKKRFARPPPPPRGLVFPVSDDKGGRSSTPANKAVLEAAVRAVSPEKADRIANAKSWRFGYVKHLQGMVEEQCKSPEAAIKVAEAGLAKAYEIFQFVGADGTSVSLKEAMSKKADDKFSTGFIKGVGASNKKVLEIPYKGQVLSGQKLKDQIAKWVDYGTIEPSAGEAMTKCVDNPGWLDLSNKYFVLLGAGSAMGPFLVLMALGANVVAVDLDRGGIWKRLIGIAKASSGSITFPMKVPQEDCQDENAMYEAAGCNLFTQTPQIRDWLLELYPGKPFTVGSYAYLNGALHVQVSLAMDAICKDLSEKRKGTSLAYLCTPTDLHLIPQEAHAAATAHYKDYSKRIYCIVMSLLSNGKFLRKNAKKPVPGEGGDFYMVNGISVAQGPNYALAKRMQHWRAILARTNAGCIVSSNIAPSTSTASVVQNKTFAWAYEGMPYFKPYEIFAPETSNAVMSAILFYDLNDPASAGNPKKKLNNPNELFKYGGFHGGTWRCAYEVDSIGEASVFIYFGRVAMPYVGIVAAVGVAVAAKVLGFF
mmetsp:Transcript_3428/g.5679  ORF Transcript_3428/g.5679 Transcript_3428/m.5679 type:complete len:750 (-) Transcript_3428:81-2330(-)